MSDFYDFVMENYKAKTTAKDLISMFREYKLPLFSILFKEELEDTARIMNHSLSIDPVEKRLVVNRDTPLFIIINLGDKKEGGTHWVLLYIPTYIPTYFSSKNEKYKKKSEKYKKKSEYPIYFDSYGIAPPKEVLKFLEDIGYDSLLYTISQIQNIRSGGCGQYVFLAAYYIINHSLDDFLLLFKK